MMQRRSRYLPLFRPVTQEHALGCAVACVASRCAISYQEALALFNRAEHAWTRGYYCDDIVTALARATLHYSFSAFHPDSHRLLLDRAGTIVFHEPCTEYPHGHFLLRTQEGWMNPWSNFPQMIPVESAIQEKIGSALAYVVFELERNA